MSCSGIYFYIYCANYCSVFVPGRLVRYKHKPTFSVFVLHRTVLVQKLNNNSHNKCKSKSTKATRLLNLMYGGDRMIDYIWSGEKQGGNYLSWRSLPFFFLRLFFCAKRQQDEDLSGNSKPGQKGQTRGPPSTRD